jgi:RNA polymerase sigma factor (sigma-70 family)
MHHRPSPLPLNEAPGSALYQCHAATIFAYLRLHAPSWEDAEDLLLEVFLAALESEQWQTVPEDKHLAWLREVAHHKLVDHLRRTKRRASVPLEQLAEVIEDEALPPEQAALYQEERRQVRAMVQRLPTLQQQVLRLRFGDGLRCAQIAVLLGKREDAVRQVLSRTINRLRTIYQDHQEGVDTHDTK